jgi:hypothetical protein
MKSIDEAKEEIFGMKYIPATLDLIEDYIVDEKDAIRAIDIATKPLVREMKRYWKHWKKNPNCGDDLQKEQVSPH